jgi:tetratricopeptide (TPR) repeat protein
MSSNFEEAMRRAAGYQQAGRLAEAEKIYRQVLTQQPNHAEALNFLGIIASHGGRWDAANDLIRRAIASKPTIAAYHSNLGVVLSHLGLLDDAIAAIRQAIRLNPDLAGAHYNLGNLLRDRGNIEEAIIALRQAVVLKPDYAEAHNNLGNVLRRKDLLDEAMEAHRRALQIKPDFAEGYNNLGDALRDNGRIDDAISAVRKAIELKPDYGDAHFNLANLLLLQGDFAHGWREYEWRWRCKTFGRQRLEFVRPLWDGTALNGRTILLHAEQGIGDTIQFVRYASMVAARGGRVVLECQPPLLRLLQGLPGIEQVVIRSQPLPNFDLHCPMFSLPLAFETKVETIPATIPYLKAEDRLSQQWASRMASSNGLKIGIVWAGSPKHSNDRNRSLPFSCLAPLAEISGIEFYSLQKGEAARQASNQTEGLQLIDYTAELNDFADTAALIANLDLIIAVDTAVAHLAGAMGKPAWVLVPYAPDWRWLLEREDSPWYPTVHLFRQPRIGNWQTPISEIARRLSELSRRRNSGRPE